MRLELLKEHYNLRRGLAVFGHPEEKVDVATLRPDIEKWCFSQLKGEWSVSRRKHHFKVKKGEGWGIAETMKKSREFGSHGQVRMVRADSLVEVIITFTYIDFENDTDAVHFKMRWW